MADAGALHADPRGGLAVVAGDLEAVVRPLAVQAETAARDRVRLEKELADTEAQLAATRARLADERFTSKARRPSSRERERARPSWRNGPRSSEHGWGADAG